MPLFADFPLLDMGSADGHARYLSEYNYRYYCVMCIRNIESKQKLEKCVHCNSANLILLMKKEVKEKIPWTKRIAKLLQTIQTEKPKKPLFKFDRFAKAKEELPTR